MNTLRSPASTAARRERGVAALVVVMVLFFVVSLVAAYTNRNLIFEQRTSANMSRSAQTFETAQAGIDWAVAMLNGGRIDASCSPSASATDTSFRQRYIDIDPVTGLITARNKSAGGADPRLSAACVYNGTGWNCSCPTDADPTPAVPAGDGQFPAFRVRLAPPFSWPSGSGPVAGIVRLEAVACPRFDFGAGRCLDFANTQGAEGRSFMSVVLSLNTAVKTTPAAALTARQNIAPSTSATMNAYNSDVPSGGVALQAGGTIGVGISAHGAAGAPASSALAPADAALSGLVELPPLLPDVDARMFSTVFGLAPNDYQTQPAAFVLGACPCSAASLRTAIEMNPGRPIWVSGDLTLDSAGSIGAADAPVVLIVDGNVQASVPITVYGVVYARPATWTIAGNIRFQGAAVAEGMFDGTGSSNFVYDAALLQRARVTNGSFVPIPASWKDYPHPP